MHGTLNESNLIGILTDDSEISASLSDGTLNGTISSTLNISGSLSYNTIIGKLESDDLIGTLNIGGGSFPDYGGSYDIIPQVDEQTLQTKNKVLRENMLIEGIPYFETSNEYGYTIYIGNEVEINGN